MNQRSLVLLCLILLGAVAACFGGVTPHNVAVVVNELSSESEAVGRYYCEKAQIPLGNLVEVQTFTTEYISRTDFAILAQRIRSKLVTQCGVDPQDPENDPIQVLVMCYGVPFAISALVQDDQTSVDSYLTLLFNHDPDLGPADFMGVSNPYLDKDVDFASFRASPDNTITSGSETYKMRYLVCRLDGYESPTVNVPGYGTMPKDIKDMIDRAAASESQRGRFVSDVAWVYDYNPRNYEGLDCSWLDSTLEPDLIVRDCETSACYVKTFDDQLGVMAYYSSGMHDTDILESTEWGRPRAISS